MSLTPSEQPDNLSAQPVHKFPGDLADDDGQALDEYFEPAYHGERDTVYVEGDKAETPVTTRLITRSYSFARDYLEPVMMLPADPNRIDLTIDATIVGGEDGTDSTAGLKSPFGLASDKSGTYTRGPFPNVGNSAIRLRGHTGAVWVKIFPDCLPVAAPEFDYSAILSITAITR